MKNYVLFLLLISVAHTCGFVVSPSLLNSSSRRNTARGSTVDLDTVSDIGYVVEVEKPLGVVFGENRAPFLGLSIDTVAEGESGATAGLRAGDQLMAVNGRSVIGTDFDKAMSILKESVSPVELQLYRGTIQSLFTIVLNRRGDDFVPEEESEIAEEIVFDETYESPVVMTVEDLADDSISVSQVAKETAETIGNIFSPKSIGGFFGQMFSQETIQLEDKDGK